MNKSRIMTKITTTLFFAAVALIIASSATGQNMMQGNNASGMANWNWVQSLVSFAIGVLIGTFFGYLSARRKK